MTESIRLDDGDVLVLGAGAAGLSAAIELARAGRDVLLLEARDRVGGRIWSQPQPASLTPVELGAEFVHGEARRTMQLLAAAGSAALEIPVEHWMLTGRGLAPVSEIFPRLRKVLSGSRVQHGRDRPFADLLGAPAAPRGAAHGGPRRLTGRLAVVARMLVEGFDAADPRRASAQSIVEEWSEGGGVDQPQFRPLGGYAVLVEALLHAARQLDVRFALQSVVTEVRWRRGRVECEGLRLGLPFRVRAARAVVTLPLGVLQRPEGDEGAVRFRPALKDKATALARLASGPVAKVTLRFDEPFWEELAGGKWRKASFFHSPRADFPTLWTARPAREPTLVAWAGGPKAARLAGSGADAVARAALACVAALFGSRARAVERLQVAHFHDWSADPFARGAYSSVMVGGRSARRRLAAPLAGTLFFAGEATDDESAATVEGALRSGERAAREILGLTS